MTLAGVKVKLSVSQKFPERPEAVLMEEKLVSIGQESHNNNNNNNNTLFHPIFKRKKKINNNTRCSE